ncbi:MAG: hypothetical protein A3G35_19350 [candidate division NC10 bacterium RIFCSPLOWO2_12_FULL_66_18]|nr:MAG: hypothetical protein A3H39_07385 [candidate division NC10 bacterium RIFCSPLOWO2_02_FULL_66_22]OGB99884.1 MAG: hypothetical protein A3G35_19350 [candidate division NC10 bacterium RIFCSPLOWO2_12_FULL_66_18]
MKREVWMSPYNRVPEVREACVPRSNVTVCDTTMREGEQAADVNLRLETRLEMARRLSDLGICQIQVGYPGRSLLDGETICRIKAAKLPVLVEALAQVFQADWKHQIDAAIESGADSIDLLYPSSDLRLKWVQKVTREEMLARSVEAIRYAAGRGPIVRFAPVDTTRTDLEFLRTVYTAALEAGAERLSVADTAGGTLPGAMRYLVSEVRKLTDVPIHVHCHDDFGLALANTLAAFEAGADILDATINGLGERAGNASLDELVVALQVLYEVPLGVKTERLAELSRWMAEVTGVPVPASKPLVGRLAFSHKLDAHVWGALEHPPVYETIPPELVGNRQYIPIGKYSGPVALKAKLEQLGILLPADREQRDRILTRIAGEVERVAVASRLAVSDETFERLAKSVIESGAW